MNGPPKLVSPTLDSGDATSLPSGRKDRCRAPECKAEIWWVLTASKRYTPVERDGAPHWARCPAALRFRKKGKRKS